MKKNFIIFTTFFTVLVNYQFQNYRFINCNGIFNLNYFLKQKKFKKNQPPSAQDFKTQLAPSSKYSTVFNWVPDVRSSIISNPNKAKWFIVISSNDNPP
jgi:hypothetical protein